ncbi:MAG: class I SAM-dependent methyltransferase [Parcubacteria group bacterium]|nr:class I SAM-dependent methyltransferase [Parcubacteria group bacterium]
MCKSGRLSQFFDLGETALANSFLSKEALDKPEPKYPLKVFFCEDCGLSQLVHVVEPEILFKNYVYFSSGMPALPEHFQKYAEEAVNNFVSSRRRQGFGGQAKDDLVVEIGSNDGLLLGAIKNLGAKVLGVDPAENIAKVANERGVETLPEFFSEKLAGKIAAKYGKAKVIIGNNVVAHIDNHHDLVKGVSALLADDGVFMFEAPYIADMFENYTFDTIYHEHLSYLSVRPLVNLFKQFGMELFDVKVFPVQGNSIRGYAGKLGQHEISPRVAELLQKEKSMKLDKLETYLKLASDVNEMKQKVRATLDEFRAEGKRIAGYGAPAKGNTLLNYFGIGPDILDYTTEALPSKIGFYTPGTHIPVVNIEDARKNPPDYFLLLAWNYKDVILKKEESMIKNGVKFIMPVGENLGLIK